jgi:hypothetical protein
MNEAIKIFLAYSRKDTKYLDELRTHFNPIERSGIVNIWYDGKIEPGSVWNKEIKARLHNADIVILLVSADAIASDYFYEQEMKDAMERHNKGIAKVVPFILRPCNWKATPLAELQAIPKDAKAVTKWTNRDEAYSDAVTQIWDMVTNIKNQRIVPVETEPEEHIEEELLAREQAELRPKQQRIIPAETKPEEREEEELIAQEQAELRPKQQPDFKEHKKFLSKKTKLLILSTVPIILALFIVIFFWHPWIKNTESTEVEHMLAQATTLVAEAKDLFAKATEGKDTTETLEATQSDIALVEASLAEGSMLLNNGYYLTALDKAKAAWDKAISINVELMHAEATTLVTEVKDLIMKVPRGKESKEALEAIQNDLTLVEASLAEVSTLLNNGSSMTALEKAKAARDKAMSLKTELEEAIARKGGK